MQVEVVRHHRRAEDADGDEQGLPVEAEHRDAAARRVREQRRVAEIVAGHEGEEDGRDVGP